MIMTRTTLIIDPTESPSKKTFLVYNYYFLPGSNPSRKPSQIPSIIPTVLQILKPIGTKIHFTNQHPITLPTFPPYAIPIKKHIPGSGASYQPSDSP